VIACHLDSYKLPLYILLSSDATAAAVHHVRGDHNTLRDKRVCPFCRKKIDAQATVFAYCRKDVEPERKLSTAKIGIVAMLGLFIVASFIGSTPDNKGEQPLRAPRCLHRGRESAPQGIDDREVRLEWLWEKL
jgi:hypothetical protein